MPQDDAEALTLSHHNPHNTTTTTALLLRSRQSQRTLLAQRDGRGAQLSVLASGRRHQQQPHEQQRQGAVTIGACVQPIDRRQ